MGLGESFGRAGEAPGPTLDFPPILAPMPAPMAVLVLVPNQRDHEQKIGPALQKLALEEPTVRHEHDPCTHKVVGRAGSPSRTCACCWRA